MLQKLRQTKTENLTWDKFFLLREGVNPSAAVAAAKSLQSSPTLCNPIDGSPPDSPVPGILQANGLPFPSPMHENEK